MAKRYKKVTAFVGRASGDCECFCFDTRPIEQAEHDRSLSLRTTVRRDDLARIYPHALIPPEAYESRERGAWMITVEWRPLSTEKEGIADGK